MTKTQKPPTPAGGTPVDCLVGRLEPERYEAAEHALLERAAFAAGLVVESWIAWGGAWAYHRDATANADGEFPIFKWAPLDDDGDALRLAVKLRIVVQHAPRYVVAISPDLIAQHEDGMTDAATRRVIVRAAAECARLKTPNKEVTG